MVSYKKALITVIITALICASIFSQNSSSVRVWVMPTEGKNLSKTESRWLPDEVHKVLRANITNYSGLTVAEENVDALAGIQSKTYNENISDKDIVLMGKQMGANYVIRSTITATGSSYSLNVVFQNLESGAHLAESNKSAATTEALYMNPGCAVNEATIELCDRLDSKFGTGLSSYNKHILRNGTNDLSQEEEAKYLEDEEKRLNQIISRLNNEINLSSVSTQTDAATIKTQLELQKAQQEERLKQTQQRIKRVAQEAENKQAELQEQAKRSTSQKNRISSMSQTLDKKVEELRKQAFNSSSILAQINVIEAKKKAFIEIREERNNNTLKMVEEGNAEAAKKRTEIIDAPLRDAQKDSNGNMLPQVKQKRMEEADKEEQRIIAEYNENIAKMQSISLEAENDLLKQIQEQRNELSKERTADNIVNRELRLYVNRFIGERSAWAATLNLMSEGEVLYTNTFDISYKTLTNKQPDVLSDEYLDDVDLYNSLFSKNLNPVMAVMKYKITAAPDNKPSQYILHVYNIVLTHTDTGKKIQEIKVDSDFIQQITPVYDIRDEKVKSAEQVKTTQEQKKAKKQADIKQGYLEYISDFDQKTGRFGSFNGFGSGVLLMSGDTLYQDHWVYVSPHWFRYAFFGVQFGTLPLFDPIKPYAAEPKADYIMGGIGFNVRILPALATNLFARVGFGGYSVKQALTNNYEYIQHYKYLKEDSYIVDDNPDLDGFIFKLDVGVDIPLYYAWLNLSAYMSEYWVKGCGWATAFTIGINISPFKGRKFRDWWDSVPGEADEKN